jgi:preprotein translocase subunit SecG
MIKVSITVITVIVAIVIICLVLVLSIRIGYNDGFINSMDLGRLMEQRRPIPATTKKAVVLPAKTTQFQPYGLCEYPNQCPRMRR